MSRKPFDPELDEARRIAKKLYLALLLYNFKPSWEVNEVIREAMALDWLRFKKGRDELQG